MQIPRPTNPDFLPGSNYNTYRSPTKPPVKRDLAYPLNIRNGGLETVVDEQITQQSILSVLETEKGERIMRQEYGLTNQLFQGVVPDVIDVEVKRSIEAQVREIDDIFTTTSNDDLENGTLRISIYWTTGGQSQPPVNLQLEK